MKTTKESWGVRIEHDKEDATVIFDGEWLLHDGLPNFDLFRDELIKPVPPARIRFNCNSLGKWESVFIVFLRKLIELSETLKIKVDRSELPEGACKLLNLAELPHDRDSARTPRPHSFVFDVGEASIRLWHDCVNILSYIGEVAIDCVRVIKGKPVFRKSDILIVIEDVSVRSLPIVGLISFLVGTIMAFVGVIQLAPFGADLYVADLVGIAMVREMGAMMAGIIMAGRTGAAFAAELGSMKVSEEIDALRTFGISPMEFLVMPRFIALSIMLPLLCIFSNFIGMIGGGVVAVSLLDVTTIQYYNETVSALSMADFSTGIIKSFVFGVLVAGSGCLRGMQCSNSATAVGAAATSAVVTGITLIVLADAVFTIIFNALDI